jgi:hypothetical protein
LSTSIAFSHPAVSRRGSPLRDHRSGPMGHSQRASPRVILNSRRGPSEVATRENVIIDEPTKRNPESELVTAGIKRFLPDEARV